MKKLLLAGLIACSAFGQNPVVRQSRVTLFTTQAATGTATSAAVLLPNNSGFGSLQIVGAGITGSPTGCQIALAYQESLGGATGTVFATQTFTPAVSNQQFNIIPSSVVYATGDSLVAVYSCSGYPSGGTLSVTWAANTPVSIMGTVPISGTFWQATQPVSVGSLPLPTGASTSAAQATGNTSLATIATNLPAQGQALAGASLPVVLTAAQITTLTPPANVGVSSLPALPAGSNTIGALTANQSVNEAQVAGVTPLMNNGVSGTGSQRVNIASDNSALPAAGQGATGSAAPSGATQVGGTDGTNLVAYYIDPCQRGPKTYDALSFTSSTQVITGTSGKKVYFCSFKVTTAAATNVAVVEGTGSVCATSVAKFPGLNASTAATGDQLSANGGFVIGSGGFAIAGETTNADNVCVLLSASNQTSVSYSYVVY